MTKATCLLGDTGTICTLWNRAGHWSPCCSTPSPLVIRGASPGGLEFSWAASTPPAVRLKWGPPCSSTCSTLGILHEQVMQAGALGSCPASETSWLLNNKVAAWTPTRGCGGLPCPCPFGHVKPTRSIIPGLATYWPDISPRLLPFSQAVGVPVEMPPSGLQDGGVTGGCA